MKLAGQRFERLADRPQCVSQSVTGLDLIAVFSVRCKVGEHNGMSDHLGGLGNDARPWSATDGGAAEASTAVGLDVGLPPDDGERGQRRRVGSSDDNRYR